MKQKAPKKPVFKTRVAMNGYPTGVDMARPFPVSAWEVTRYMTAPMRVELRFYAVKKKWYSNRVRVKARTIGSEQWRDAWADYFLSFNEARKHLISLREADVRRDRQELKESEEKLAASRAVPRMKKKENIEFPPRPVPKAKKAVTP